MDFSLIRNRTYKIRGQIVDPPESNAGPGIGVNVTAEDGSHSIGLQSTVNPNGSFEVSGLAPGNYVLTAYGHDDGRFSARGFARVAIVDADLDSVRLEIKRGAEIHGRVAMEGMTALPTTLLIFLRTKEVDFAMAGANARVRKDGTFEMRDVLDGAYQIETRTDCETCYLKAARVNDVDVLENGLQVVGGISQPLELVYSSHSARVDGVVTKGDNLPAPSAPK